MLLSADPLKASLGLNRLFVEPTDPSAAGMT
jgi:hypothetical protein